LALGMTLSSACATVPPRQTDDICSIFREKRDWLNDAESARERWGVSEAVQLAIIHQESTFQSKARPARGTFLWVFPGARPSSAYGYGQVVDGTWALYQRSTGRGGASRSDFGDVTDFIGWYAHGIQQVTGIPKNDAYRLYIAYHEGPQGYKRGTHKAKAWLPKIAQKVKDRAARYQRQFDGCKKDLPRGSWFWPF
jgi:hypothetical protein